MRFRPVPSTSCAGSARFGLVAIFSAITLLAGSSEAQQYQKGISPLPNSNQSARSLSVVTPRATVPLTPAAVFSRHSRPNAAKRIYLDFDGHVTSGTPWNSGQVPAITTEVYSLDADPSFSDADLAAIQEVWERVAECFSPFDVDVTTEEPSLSDLINTGAGDTRWGMRVAIGDATPSPAPGAGGVAFLNSFGDDPGTGADIPCFVFDLGAAKYIADASVHEVGHTLGLNHDGRTIPRQEYYGGHGPLSPNPVGWAPHMGVGYDRELVQWSKGEYPNSSNKEDDLLKITTSAGNGFGYRSDDFANSLTQANTANTISGSGLNTGAFSINQSGVIETRSDSDWFKIVVNNPGTLSLNAASGATYNTMLDIRMDLMDANGVTIATSDPTTDVTASISVSVSAGTYFVKIDGVGNGNLTTGYSDYGSLGTYRITGTTPAPAPTNVTAAYSAGTLTLTGDTGSNTVTVTLKSGVVTVEGALATKINSSTSFARSHTGALKIVADMGNGNDSLSIVGVSSSTTDVKLGGGNDKLVITLSSVQILKVDGGPGTDTLVTTSSTIPPVGANRVITNVP